MAEYKLRKRADACAVTGRPFQPGETVVSAIYDDPEGGFLRKDMCEEAFREAGEPFSHWRARHPEPPGDDRRLDYALAMTFFDRLVRKADPAQEGLVYVLALLLSRKRKVKIEGARPLPEGELLTVSRRGPEEDESLQVRAPRLDSEEAERLQEELARLFDFAADGGKTESDGPPAANG